MKKLLLSEIRKKWIKFFEEKNHYLLPYSSLIPINDHSLLWINSGVATLKPYFEGKLNPPSKRLVNSQKSIRTNDIENIGYTSRHHSLFEMLGNFSIGDYFKKEAIQYAWELLTSDKWFGLDKDKLYVTVYEKDKETYDIWNNDVNLSKDRIIKGNKKTNFWEIGVGPCGPNTEIFYDRGEKYDSKKIGLNLLKNDIENDRYLEIWNIVFSEFNSDGNGKYNNLPRKNIDTGAGLERLATVLQDVPTNFDIDIFQKIIHKIEKLTDNKFKYDKDNFFTNEKNQKRINICFKIISDHIRAIVFTIADGVYPNNKNRGYVIRRLIRRSQIYGKRLEIKGSFLYKLVDVVIEVMKDYYSYLIKKNDFIKQVIKEEEERFLNTLLEGEKQLLQYIKSNKSVNSKQTFILYETYGFPIELTQEICNEYNIKIDIKKFNDFLNEHKKLAKSNQKNVSALLKQNEFLIKLNIKSKFVGYDKDETNSKILFIFKDNKKVNELYNDRGYLILDKTPFYAEKGGQAADNGNLIAKNNLIIKVIDVQSGPNGEHIHYVETIGKIKIGDNVKAIINKEKRFYTRKNHSATHLLSAAIKEKLNKDAIQNGSYNDDKGFKIDVSYNKKITFKEIEEINKLCNNKIQENIKREIIFSSYEDAINKHKAIAFFKDKYNTTEKLRIVKFGDFSIELCGGTHVFNTKEIEKILIVKYSSVGNNTYRISAITSNKTINEYINNLKDELNKHILELEKIDNNYDVLQKLNQIQKPNFKSEDVINIVDRLKKQIDFIIKEKKRILKENQEKSNNDVFNKYTKIKLKNIKNINVISETFNNMDIKVIRRLIVFYTNKYKKNLIIIFNNIINKNKKGIIIFALTSDLENKYSSEKIIKKINPLIDGKGGGKSSFAQSGYSNFNALKKIMQNIGEYL